MDDSVEDDWSTEFKKAQKIEIMDDNVNGQSTESKKVQKMEIMKQRELQRKDKLQEDRIKTVSVKRETEKPHYIVNKFEEIQREILPAFDEIENCPNPTDGLRMLQQCYGKLDELREFFDAFAYLLNNYHLRKLRENYRQLEEKCQQLEQRLKPRKKFGFSRTHPVSVDVSRDTTIIPNGNKTDGVEFSKKSAINGTVINGDKPNSNVSNGVDVVDNRTTAASNNIDKRMAAASNIVEDSVIGFRDKKCEKLSMRHEEIACKDVQLTNLQRCQVKLYGSPMAVYVASLEHCEIFCGPTLSSVLVESCRNCTFILACQQLRIHTSTDCKFYTYVTSRTVIENCKGIQFAPYAWKYDDDRIESHFEQAYHGRPNNWQAIDDFDCLSINVPSPNWSFIKDDERIIFPDN